MVTAAGAPTRGSDHAVLRVDGLSKAFGGLRAVRACSLAVDAGSISGLIGPNGSGKSTLFNMVSGLVRPDAGEVFLRGERITDVAPYGIVRKGLARTFQITRLFPKLTVLANLLVAAPAGSVVASERRRAQGLLELVALWGHRGDYAEQLSYGQQKLLELMRALMPRPSVLLLDEPFAGVNRVMAARLVELIRGLRRDGLTFFVIDHEMKLVMELCDRLFVMDSGELIADGPPAEVRANERVLEAYFGR